MVYLVVSIFFGFFYIPFSNKIEMLDILTNHSSLLTILFCMAVVSSSYFSFDTTTTSIISLFVAILAFYKVLNIKKN